MRKNYNNNIPADKNIVCSEKRIQFCNFSSVFQTLLNSNFIDAVYTTEILFSPKFFAKIQVRVICKCGLYTPVYGYRFFLSSNISHRMLQCLSYINGITEKKKQYLTNVGSQNPVLDNSYRKKSDGWGWEERHLSAPDKTG